MKKWIDLLKLERHIEGGYYGIFYKSSDKILTLDDKYSNPGLDSNERTERHAGSSIYFLLEKEDFSAWHRLNSDEIWHYYDGGSPIDIYIINEYGCLIKQTLGNPLLSDEASFQVVIKAGDWFTAEVRDKSSFALMGCTVSPGFEYCDFTLADRHILVYQYPEHSDIINKLTRINPATIDLLPTEASTSTSSYKHTPSSSSVIKKNISSSSETLVSSIGLYSRLNDPKVIDSCFNNTP